MPVQILVESKLKFSLVYAEITNHLSSLVELVMLAETTTKQAAWLVSLTFTPFQSPQADSAIYVFQVKCIEWRTYKVHILVKVSRVS